MNTATATGVATSPGADVLVVELTAGQLPAGLYTILVQASYGGTVAPTVDRNNLVLKTGGGAVLYTVNIPGAAATNPAAVNTSPPLQRYLDGSTSLQVRTLATASAAAVYSASILATPVGYGGA